jgi:hypothetical protein
MDKSIGPTITFQNLINKSRNILEPNFVLRPELVLTVIHSTLFLDDMTPCGIGSIETAYLQSEKNAEGSNVDM